MKSEEAQIKGPLLEKPVRITEQVWPEGTVPVVTIRCITYQHVNFIREAIEGFLMQETTFPVEIIIHDDASTDGTAEIVKEYANKHPQLFRTILQKENQYSQGPEVWARVRNRMNEMQRGEFIAICEGDDYWISKQKLQKQVDCLRNRPNSSAVFHWVLDESSDGRLDLPAASSNRDWALNEVKTLDLLEQNVITTCSAVFRSAMRPIFAERYNKLPMGDWPLWIRLALQAPIFCLNERMAVYRFHGQGLWSKKSDFEHLTGCAMLFPVISTDLPVEMQRIAWQRFEQFIERAAISLLCNQEISNFSFAVTFVRMKIKESTPLIDSEFGADKMMHDAIVSAVKGLCADRANKAWEHADFHLARRYFGILIRSPAFGPKLCLKWIATFIGKLGIEVKKQMRRLLVANTR